MFNLTEQELQHAFEALEHHGYGALLPRPPEWSTLQLNWEDLKKEISAIDLDTYHPAVPLRVYAPKTRATVRVVSLLHPVDLLIYTALTLLVKDDLESFRIPTARNIVYSYRTEIGATNRLYGQHSLFASFQQRLEQRSRRGSVKYVAIADIADFYPRINQHRLENVIESCAKSERSKEVARVLVRKLISNLSGTNSYGIPVGPYASRILGEAVLIDVDSYLVSERLIVKPLSKPYQNLLRLLFCSASDYRSCLHDPLGGYGERGLQASSWGDLTVPRRDGSARELLVGYPLGRCV